VHMRRSDCTASLIQVLLRLNLTQDQPNGRNRTATEPQLNLITALLLFDTVLYFTGCPVLYAFCSVNSRISVSFVLFNILVPPNLQPLVRLVLLQFNTIDQRQVCISTFYYLPHLPQKVEAMSAYCRIFTYTGPPRLRYLFQVVQTQTTAAYCRILPTLDLHV
jgi:hypothetical protein